MPTSRSRQCSRPVTASVWTSDKSLRYEAVPAALIGRLARHERVRGRGVGELLLADAISRVLGAVRAVVAFAIVVDAKDERAMAFYRAFWFIPFPPGPRRLFLLTETAAAGLERAAR